MGQRDLLGTRVLASHLVVSVDKVKQYSTDPERFATVSIGIGDRVLFHPAPREPRHKCCEVFRSESRASGSKTLGTSAAALLLGFGGLCQLLPPRFVKRELYHCCATAADAELRCGGLLAKLPSPAFDQ